MAVVLDVDRVSFGYRDRQRLAEDVSFQVSEGDVLCLLGPNGAGKSTLLRCLLGMHPAGGRIVLRGTPLDQMSRREIARAVAYVPQSIAASLSHRAGDMVLMGRNAYVAVASVPSPADEALALEALDRLGVAHLADRSFDQMSGGERQLVLIARALCQEAPLLVMDEPTSHLDYGNQVRILRTVNDLRRRGYAIVMTAHNPDHAFLSATHVAILAGGRLSAVGSPEAIVTGERLSEVYRTPIRVVVTDSGDGSGELVRACVPVLS